MTAPADLQDRTAEADGIEQLAIEIEGMSVWYGRTQAVRDLSMHVPSGSIYGFVGPSGAGKTTTIRTLATLRQPDAGTVLVDGFDVQAEPEAVRSRVGYMPDFSGVYESLTVSEYLDFYASIYRIPPARRRQLTDELLELINLVDQRNNPVGRLSRGMKQQLGIARCLIHDPQILLLDEPASGMDPQARIELRDILEELARLDKTILISSHILPELAEMCTHIGIVRDGELLAEGPTHELLGRVSPNLRLHVRLLEPADRDAARRCLEAHPALRQSEDDGDSGVLAEFTGAEQDLAAILSELVTSGVRVTEFSLERSTLEDLFLLMSERSAEA